MKKIIFYEKFKSFGHRSYIIDSIKNNFVSDTDYQIIVLCNNDKHENFLKTIIEFYKKKKIDYCHLLTFEDCVNDFNDKKLLNEFLSLKISLSATLFNFEFIQFLNILIPYKNFLLKNFFGTPEILLNLLKKNIIKKILIPDERVKNIFLYPFFNDKIEYLPDFTRFKIKKINKKKICEQLNIDYNIPTFLMFGKMDKYKGLKLLAEVINKNLISTELKLNFIIAGKNIERIKIKNANPNINIIQYDKFIETDLANKLFSISDCVVMPFDKNFKQSSGTFSIACAYGKFIIAPRGGVICYRIKKYKNGILFKDENILSLAKQINKFIRIRNTLQYPILGSIEYSKLCSIEKYIDRLKKSFI